MKQSEFILETSGLSKSYGSFTALEDINVRFEDRKIYGLFGRNGAGKTSLLNIISSRIFADRGDVFCFGENSLKNPDIVARSCCYMPEKHYFPGKYTVKKLLSAAKQSFPNFSEDYAERLCHSFKLFQGQKYEQLSRGHQSVFRIVLGLASRAPITIFDEPVLGLDATARDRFYLELVEDFAVNPRLFIISTHLIEESSDLYNEAVIIKNGKIIKQESVEALLSGVFYVSGKDTVVDEFIAERTVLASQTVNNQKTAVVEGNMKDEKQLPGIWFSQLSFQKLFIHLTRDSIEQEQWR